MTRLTDYGMAIDEMDTIDVFVSQKIGQINLYGSMSPTRAMLLIVADHAEGLAEGQSSDYHAILPDGPISVSIVRG